MENFAQIDQFCQAVITNTVANRASRTQGTIFFNLIFFYFDMYFLI